MKRLPTFAKDKVSSYVAKAPDSNGHINYTDEEHETWSILYSHQLPLLQDHACEHFFRGLELLELPRDRIPQCYELSEKLQEATGFSVEPVPALIPDEEFFQLLSERKFPAATFIRTRDELHYLQEPDLFHEFFGHCPMLTDPACADFSQAYGKQALKANADDRALLARLYWFTIEFGLIQQKDGLRAYGGGILSSPGELIYSTTSDQPERKPLDILTALRTPYRIDRFQPIYFVLNEYQDLYKLFNGTIDNLIVKAHELGDFAPTFPIDDLV